MSEELKSWKGPWKCTRCGWMGGENGGSLDHRWNWDGQLCAGSLIPYERRVADEGMRELVVALREIATKKLTKAQMRAIAKCHLIQEMPESAFRPLSELLDEIDKKHGKE